MKTTLSLFLLFITSTVSVSTATAAAKSDRTHPIAYSVEVVNLDQNGATIARGTPTIKVLQMLGTSYRRISENTWMYGGFSSSNASATQHGCDQLLITFTKGKISDLKLTNRHTAQLIARNVPLQMAGSAVAGK